MAAKPTITLTPHAEWKLETLSPLGITLRDIEETITNPDERLYDTQTDHLIAVNHNKNLIVVYDMEDHRAKIVTIIYTTRLPKLLERRKKQGRWI